MADPVLDGKYAIELDEIASLAANGFLVAQPAEVLNKLFKIKSENYFGGIPIPIVNIQQVTITNANATSPLAINSNSNVIEVTLDAALTQEWKPNAITGAVKYQWYWFVGIQNSTQNINFADTTNVIFPEDLYDGSTRQERTGINPWTNWIDVVDQSLTSAVGWDGTKILFNKMLF